MVMIKVLIKIDLGLISNKSVNGFMMHIHAFIDLKHFISFYSTDNIWTAPIPGGHYSV